ncbi:hypothetical protein ATANTOWER_029573, partial [Ataeniobius toweri]|nr:hypothetical protein [Ataeniobius toweri]
MKPLHHVSRAVHPTLMLMPLRVHLTPQLTPLTLAYKTAMQTLAPKVPAFSLKPTTKLSPRLTFRTLSSPPLPAAKVSMPLPVFSSSSLLQSPISLCHCLNPACAGQPLGRPPELFACTMLNGNGLTEIQDYAFNGTQLEEVYLYRNMDLEHIAEFAFYGVTHGPTH